MRVPFFAGLKTNSNKGKGEEGLVRSSERRYQLLVYSEHDTVFVRSDLVPDLEALPPGAVFASLKLRDSGQALVIDGCDRLQLVKPVAILPFWFSHVLSDVLRTERGLCHPLS